MNFKNKIRIPIVYVYMRIYVCVCIRARVDVCKTLTFLIFLESNLISSLENTFCRLFLLVPYSNSNPRGRYPCAGDWPLDPLTWSAVPENNTAWSSKLGAPCSDIPEAWWWPVQGWPVCQTGSRWPIPKDFIELNFVKGLFPTREGEALRD